MPIWYDERMTKATHNGTCQVCGRQQAHTDSRGLAKHGYTVKDWGFNGTCCGSDKPPVETSTTLLDDTVISLTAQADRLAAKTLETIEVVVLEHYADRERGDFRTLSDRKIRTSVHSQAEFDLWKAERGPRSGYCYWKWDATLKGELRRLHGIAEQIRGHVKFLQQLRATRHGQPLIPRRVGAETS